MARRIKSKGVLVRRLGINVFQNPKFDELLEHRGPKTRPKEKEYLKQLIEKQKVRFYYGLAESQMEDIYLHAKAIPGITGEVMLGLLERRLDNVIYHLRIGGSRPHARQIVSHGHVQVNGRPVDIPSFLVKAGDRLGSRGRAASQNLFRLQAEQNQNRPIPGWLELLPGAEQFTATVRHNPEVQDLPAVFDMSKVVEYYSK